MKWPKPGLIIWFVFLLLPIYWLINMSLKTNEEILSGLTFVPHNLTFANYLRIFTDSAWYSGYINSLIYVAINVSARSITSPTQSRRSRSAPWALTTPSDSPR